MAESVVPIVATDLLRQRKRAAAKGRSVEPAAVAEVRGLLGSASRERDQLIEQLHRLQDRHGHLSAAHLAALAAEMGLAQVEIYEVASFYHPFPRREGRRGRTAGGDRRVCGASATARRP